MPDITMCDGKECDMKEKCYRYICKPCNHQQSYFLEAPIKDGKCSEFWEIKKGKQDDQYYGK